MLQVSVKELTASAFQREALKIANNAITKSVHYIPEADMEVFNIDLEAYNVTSLEAPEGNIVYIVFADDHKIIRTMKFHTYEFMDLIIR